MFNSKENPKIGIPKTLFYYSYYPVCYKFFTELGAEVIFSEKTNKTTIEAGLNTSSNELCIPLKVLYGHVMYLKDKVDYIFLPYVISYNKGSYYCPKIIGSPDIIKANVPGIELLSFDIDMDNFYSSIWTSLMEVATKLSFNPVKIYSAFKEATEYQKNFDKLIAKGILFEDAVKLLDAEDSKKRVTEILKEEKLKSTTIAVIGHTYIINDAHISFNVIKKLRERNIRVVTSDKLTDTEVYNNIKHLEKPHWSLGCRVLGSGIYYSKDKDVDGIIYVTPFSCSSDSLIKEYMDANVDNKPILTLTVDEHSSDAGMITRIEAFLDMIDRRKNQKEKEKTTELDINEMLNESAETD